MQSQKSSGGESMKPIDRKACAAYFAPTLRLDTNSGVFHFPGIQYVIVTDIKIIGHRRLLLLYLLPRARAAAGDFYPSYIVFQAADNFMTYDMRPESKPKCRTATLERLGDDHGFFSHLAFYRRTDEDRVKRFCKYSGTDEDPVTGLGALSYRQSTIAATRSQKARTSRGRNLARQMSRLKPHGKRFEQWAKNEILPKYIIYKYRKGANTIKGICTACGNDVEVLGAKHNLSYICPACHKSVTLKSVGKARSISDRATVLRFDRIDENELALRTFKVYWHYSCGHACYEFHESARTFIQWDKSGTCSAKRYWNSNVSEGGTTWRHGLRPQYGCWQKSFEADTEGILWTRNVSAALRGTPWQYSEIGSFFGHARISNDAEEYLAQYLRKPCIEYLVKLRLFRLASYLVYRYDNVLKMGHKRNALCPEGRQFQEVLGVGTEDLPLMQELDISYTQLCILQSMRRTGMLPSNELLLWCDKYRIDRLQDISTPLKYMTPHKLVRYATEQFEANKLPDGAFYYRGAGFSSISQMLGDYRDYLFMCEGQGYDMKNPFVLFPKDMQTAHDRVMKLSDSKKMKIYNKQIVEQYAENTMRYGFKRDGLMIVAPKSAREITREGQSLHHCVGNYVGRMATQECVILFLRKEDAPNKSFCTIEVSDGRIQQARANMNTDPPPDAEKFLEKWRKQVLEQPYRKRPAASPVLAQAA